MLKGATLDYKDGLQGAGFAINNPNARAQLRLRPVLLLSRSALRRVTRERNAHIWTFQSCAHSGYA